MIGIRHLSALIFCCLAGMPVSILAAPTATEIVERVETVLWGKTIQGDFEMIVATPAWSKSYSIKLWMDRPARTLARIVAPARESGIASLRIGSEMWNYMPSIERTIKIPPSLMLQPWFGSDFTNDDMVKESSFVNDYTHKIIGESRVDRQDVYQVEGLPKPAAAVVWGKVVFTVRKADFIPVETAFYDERGEHLRTLRYSDIRAMGGRNIPTRWEMKPLNKPGQSTTIIIHAAAYDRPLGANLFSLRNLTQRD